MANSYAELPLNQIKPNPNQPRRTFNEESLKELAQSIKINGVLQPIRVRTNCDGYELIAGERRWRASQLAGLVTIPAVICETSDEKILQEQIIENLQRENVGYMDEARAIGRLREDLSLDVKEISRLLGKGEAYIYNYLSLTKLPPSVQLSAEKKQFTVTVALMIAALPDAAQQIEAGLALARERGQLVPIPKAKEYLTKKYGEQRTKRRPKTVLQKQNYDYEANWKKYLVNFTPEQFVRFKSIVCGRTETTILSEAVDMVMKGI
jgi:ParB family transcriptional regulator, chromosome partitioning protein